MQETTIRSKWGSDPGVWTCLAMLATCAGACRLEVAETVPGAPGPDAESPADGRVSPVVGSGAGDGSPRPSDAAAPDLTDGMTGAADDRAPVDATSAQLDTSASADSLPAGCGTSRPDISGIVSSDGLAIGPDGTIYFTQIDDTTGWVGRLRPEDALSNPTWVTIPGGNRLFGLAITPRGERLYVVSESGHAIHFIDLGASATPTLQVLVANLIQPNDVVVGPDGAIYYSEQGDGRIHSVSPDGIMRVVTPDPIPGSTGPAGLAFGNQGELYVGVSSEDGPIYQFRLLDGVEMSRSRFGNALAWANALLVDRAGSLYVATYSLVAQGRVGRLPASGQGETILLQGTSFSSMAFGRGALDCLDLYVTTLAGPLQRIRTDPATPPGP
jgi:sugar lactone lactonase YvrE